MQTIESSGRPEHRDQQKPLVQALFVVLPQFSGYAALFTLQKLLKDLHYQDVSGFEHYFSALYIGNLLFRMGHNFVFAPFTPRSRVFISLGSMLLSMSMLFIITLQIGDWQLVRSPSIAFVPICYFLGGCGIGTFEANMLHELAPVGTPSKRLAMTGIPIGIMLITIGAVIILNYIHNRICWIYLFVVTELIIGIGMMFFFVPDSSAPIPDVASDVEETSPLVEKSVSARDCVAISGKREGQTDWGVLMEGIKEWRHWLPKITIHTFCMGLNMFCVSMMSPGVILFIYTAKHVRIAAGAEMTKDWFLAIYDAFYSLGDSSSRLFLYPGPPTGRIKFHAPVIKPYFLLLLNLGGVAMACSTVPIISWFGGFLIAFGNGSIYSQSVFMIDTEVDRKYSLIALSFWLFAGDIGSVIGSNLIAVVSKTVNSHK